MSCFIQIRLWLEYPAGSLWSSWYRQEANSYSELTLSLIPNPYLTLTEYKTSCQLATAFKLWHLLPPKVMSRRYARIGLTSGCLHVERMQYCYEFLFWSRHNIRDLFESFRGEEDVAKRHKLLATGWRNLSAMRQLSKLEEKELREVFKPWVINAIADCTSSWNSHLPVLRWRIVRF